MYDELIFQIYESLKNEDYILALYYAKQQTEDILKRIEAISLEQTTGTWTDVPQETLEVKKRCVGRVIGVYPIPQLVTTNEFPNTEKEFLFIIAYPVDNIKNQFAELITTLYGNISMVTNLKLLDVFFPERFIKNFKGPNYGIDDLRKLLNVYNRPLLVGMFKPCIGAQPNVLGKMLYEMGVGGIDLVKDDELLADPDFCSVEQRLEECLKAIEKVKSETGKTVLYTINITDEPDRMLRKAEKVKKMGGNALMVNVYVNGYGTLRMINENTDLPILAHPAFAGTYYASPDWGLSAHLVLGKLLRLAGPDIIIYPGPYGKVPLRFETAIRVAQELKAPFYHLKPVLPGPAAGMHPGIVPKFINDFGIDTLIGAGGGIHGHPDGTISGVKAFFEAIEYSINSQDLEKLSNFKKAIQKWGFYQEKQIYDLRK